MSISVQADKLGINFFETISYRKFEFEHNGEIISRIYNSADGNHRDPHTWEDIAEDAIELYKETTAENFLTDKEIKILNEMYDDDAIEVEGDCLLVFDPVDVRKVAESFADQNIFFMCSPYKNPEHACAYRIQVLSRSDGVITDSIFARAINCVFASGYDRDSSYAPEDQPSSPYYEG